MAEIDIKIDGIYCPKCNKLHPNIFWHEKHFDYLDKEKWSANLLTKNNLASKWFGTAKQKYFIREDGVFLFYENEAVFAEISLEN